MEIHIDPASRYRITAHAVSLIFTFDFNQYNGKATMQCVSMYINAQHLIVLTYYIGTKIYSIRMMLLNQAYN